MKKRVLWVVTIAMLLIAVVFLMWAVQTAWLGSFPERDKAKYSMWAALQLAGALVSVLSPRWRRASAAAHVLGAGNWGRKLGSDSNFLRHDR